MVSSRSISRSRFESVTAVTGNSMAPKIVEKTRNKHNGTQRVHGLSVVFRHNPAAMGLPVTAVTDGAATLLCTPTLAYAGAQRCPASCVGVGP